MMRRLVSTHLRGVAARSCGSVGISRRAASSAVPVEVTHSSAHEEEPPFRKETREMQGAKVVLRNVSHRWRDGVVMTKCDLPLRYQLVGELRNG